MAKTRNLNIRIDERQESWLTRLGTETLAEQCREDLETLQTMLVNAGVSMTDVLTVDEALSIVDTYNGHWYTATDAGDPVGTLHLMMSDAIRLNDVDKTYGIDSTKLLTRIKEMNPIQALWCVHQARLFWADHEGKDARDLARKLFRCRS